MDKYMLPCLNKKLFGVECMGCGIQRSISLIFQGEFSEAFHMYPAIYTLILLFSIIAFNLVKSFKYAYKIIFPLAILNCIIIISSFVIKTFFSHH